MNNLGAKLKEQGRLQTWLAEQLDVHPATIGNYIAGRSCPTAIQAQRIDELLGATVGWQEADQEPTHPVVPSAENDA